MARSRLYRSQILQVNIRWKALDEIYKICMFLHRSDLNISANFRREFLRLARCADSCELTANRGERASFLGALRALRIGLSETGHMCEDLHAGR